MSTDTHDLIDKLSRDVKPVRPLPRAGVRALVLSVWAIALGLLILHVEHEPRPDLAATLRQPVYLLQGVAMFMAGLLAAMAAFRLSVPDTKIRPPVIAMMTLSACIWLVMILGELLQAGWTMPEPAQSCFIGLTMAMSAPLALGLFMVMRSAAVWRGWAGFALVLAVGSFGALCMRFICPNDSPAHLLVWHFLPVLGLSLLGMPLGWILLKLKVAKK